MMISFFFVPYEGKEKRDTMKFNVILFFAFFGTLFLLGSRLF